METFRRMGQQEQPTESRTGQVYPSYYGDYGDEKSHEWKWEDPVLSYFMDDGLEEESCGWDSESQCYWCSDTIYYYWDDDFEDWYSYDDDEEDYDYEYEYEGAEGGDDTQAEAYWKGKGKGGGQSNDKSGNCFECGSPFHRVADCPIRKAKHKKGGAKDSGSTSG